MDGLDIIIHRNLPEVFSFLRNTNTSLSSSLVADLHHYFYESLSWSAKTDADDDAEIEKLFLEQLIDRGFTEPV
jgi:hypothetical protein